MIYDNLPVFKTAYDLLLLMFHISKNLQREYRYTLGENVKNELVKLLVCIYNANSNPDKIPYLAEAQQHIVVIKLQVRLLSDLKQIPLKQYAAIAELIASISKQLSSWVKYIAKKDGTK